MPRSRCTLAQHRGQGCRLGHVEPGRGLVGHQQAGLTAQGAAQLHQPAMAQTEGGHRHIGQLGQPDELEDGVDMGEFIGLGPAHIQQVLPQRPVATAGPLGHDHVVAHRQLREDLDALEGASDPEAGPHVRRHVVEDVSVERHRAPARTELTAQAIEQRGLSGPVGAHQAHGLSGGDGHRHVLERGHAAEPDGDRLRRREGAVPRLCRGRRTPERSRVSPPGSQPLNGFPEGMLTAGTADAYPGAGSGAPPRGGPALLARRAS